MWILEVGSSIQDDVVKSPSQTSNCWTKCRKHDAFMFVSCTDFNVTVSYLFFFVKDSSDVKSNKSIFINEICRMFFLSIHPPFYIPPPCFKTCFAIIFFKLKMCIKKTPRWYKTLLWVPMRTNVLHHLRAMHSSAVATDGIWKPVLSCVWPRRGPLHLCTLLVPVSLENEGPSTPSQTAKWLFHKDKCHSETTDLVIDSKSCVWQTVNTWI